MNLLHHVKSLNDYSVKNHKFALTSSPKDVILASGTEIYVPICIFFMRYD